MSFRIPTVEEARKRQEKSVSIFQKPLEQIKLSSESKPAASSNENSRKHPATPAIIVNPYAKKQKVNERGVSADQSKTISKPPNNKESTSQQQPRTPLATLRPAAAATNGASYTSFGEAFRSIEDSPHFEKEMEKLKGQNIKRGDFDPKDIEQQRAMDAADAAENSINTSVSANARDNHVFLQPHVLHVSTKQRGNKVLQSIRNVPYEFSKMVPDYIMGTNRCALFLSCKYHNLNPAYIHRRIAELKNDFDLRVLLCLVDIEDNASTLLFLNKLAVVNNMTLILAWSNEEAARYLETFKAYESKDASSIQRREKETYSDQVADVLSVVRSVNKTDSAQLLSQFGNLRGLISATMDELSLCPGIGEKKVKRLYDAFHKPFSSASSKKRLGANETTKSDQAAKNNSNSV